VGLGFAVGDGAAPAPPVPARLGTVLPGTVLPEPVLPETVLLGRVPGVADPEPGTAGPD
jgi:hypothetical protein